MEKEPGPLSAAPAGAEGRTAPPAGVEGRTAAPARAAASPAPRSSFPGRAYGAVLLAAALWGALGVWNRELQAFGLSPASVTGLRNLSGLALLTVLFALRDRRVFRVRLRHLPWFFGTGVVGVLGNALCYFSCQRVCSLAVASVLLYTAPAIVVVLSALLWREPLTPRKLAALGLTFLGCACVTGLFSGTPAATAPGLLAGFGSGFFYALYTIFSRCALREYDPMTVTYWSFVFSALGSLFLLRPAELAAGLASPCAWLALLGLAVLSTALPYLLYTWALSQAEAGRAAIAASLEPAVASLLGAALFGEPLDLLTGAGVLCVLAGVSILR